MNLKELNIFEHKTDFMKVYLVESKDLPDRNFMFILTSLQYLILHNIYFQTFNKKSCMRYSLIFLTEYMKIFPYIQISCLF